MKRTKVTTMTTMIGVVPDFLPEWVIPEEVTNLGPGPGSTADIELGSGKETADDAGGTREDSGEGGGERTNGVILLFIKKTSGCFFSLFAIWDTRESGTQEVVRQRRKRNARHGTRRRD
jgi:hypothetical protein